MDQMTYANLLEVLQQMTPEQLSQDVMLYEENAGVFYKPAVFEQIGDNEDGVDSTQFVIKT